MTQGETPGKTGTDWSDWRSQLPQLDNHNLYLLPIGAKPPERKAPVDPLTGYGLKNWQHNAGYTTAALAAANPKHVIAVGLNTGHAGILVVDIDGASAAEWLKARGLDVDGISTWAITRTTSPDRFKLVFRLTPEQEAVFPQTKLLLRTTQGEALEVYFQPGAQVIVLGEHPKSGGHYSWRNSPADIATPSPEWMDAFAAIKTAVEELRGKGDRSKPPKVGRTGGTGSRWQASGHRNPCPICGRDHSAACTWTEDQGRRLATCFHGGTFAPPDGLQTGDVITGKDGNEWALVRTYHADCLGEKSLFVNHQEQPAEEPLDLDDAFPDLPSDGPAGDAPQQPQGDPSAGGEGFGDTPPPPGQPKASKARKPRPGGARLTPFQVLTALPERLGGEPRLDLRSGSITTPEGTLSGNDCSDLYLKLSSKRETWPKDATADAVNYLARANAFDPVLDYLQALHCEPLPLEQWQRLDLHLLGIDDPIAAEFLPRFLISAVARTFEPGCGVRQSPVLIGPQWRGKTALGRILFGEKHWVEGVGSMDREAEMRCHTAWGVELSELNGVSRRSDQEAIKAFLTERSDVFRQPYDRAPDRHPRRFAFWGTSNAPPFRDSTGSTRFVSIPIPDRMLPLDWAVTNRNPLWRQAVLQYKAGVNWDRCTEEGRQAISERNENFTELDPWADMVIAYLENPLRLQDLPARIPAILDYLEVPKERHNAANAARVRALAAQVGWTWGRHRPAPGINPARGLWPEGRHS